MNASNDVGIVVDSQLYGGDPLEDGTPGGWQFNHILKRAGLTKEMFTFVRGVLDPALPKVIERTQPKAFLAMGAISLKTLAHVSGGITHTRGFIHDSPQGTPVVGSFHPSYLLPRKGEKSAAKYTWVVIMDIRKALRIAQGKREQVPQHYLMDPSIDGAIQFVNEYQTTPADTLLAWDLETLYKMEMKNEQTLELTGKQPITRISFAWKPGYAMSIPYTAEMRDRIVKPLMGFNRPKVGWNSKGFDEPIVKFQEGMALNGDLLDGMDQFHVFQPNIERNLEFATSLLTDHLKPWKHMSQSDPEFYSCVDADATITDVLRLGDMMRSVQVPEYD